MKRMIAPVFILVIAVGAGCAKKQEEEPESMLTAPSALTGDVTASADAQRGHTDRATDRPDFVSLRGTIRDLNDRHNQFVLVLPTTDAQPEPRTVVVRLDDRTSIVFDGHLVRRSALRNGQECSVDGLLRVDHVLARKITLARRPDRR